MKFNGKEYIYSLLSHRNPRDHCWHVIEYFKHRRRLPYLPFVNKHWGGDVTGYEEAQRRRRIAKTNKRARINRTNRYLQEKEWASKK